MTSDLVTHKYGAIRLTELNRPQALNALSFDMIRALHDVLEQDAGDTSLSVHVLTGAGEKAFCAGGDVKAVYYAGKKGPADESNDVSFTPQDYFSAEYDLDSRLYHYPLPTLALMDGITMGGGYGLSGACDFRVATERTVFAMPEVGIGFFPDVGAAYYLNAMPGYTGMYLALTGNQLRDSADLLYTGVATHFVPASGHEDLLRELESVPGRDVHGQTDISATYQHITQILDTYHTPPKGDSALENSQSLIDYIFGAETLHDLLQRLESDESDWARNTLSVIRSRSPLSLAVTFRHLKMAEDESFDSVISRDKKLAARFMEDHDYYEGVRAMLVDKDKTPKWELSGLAEIGQERLASYFP